MRMHDRRIKVKVSANPYKSAGLKVHVIDAQAGANLRLLPGRGRVRPVFESAQMCIRDRHRVVQKRGRFDTGYFVAADDYEARYDQAKRKTLTKACNSIGGGS